MPCRPAQPELVEVLRSALGDGWTLTGAWLLPGILVADCRDPRGVAHRLEARRKRDGLPSFVDSTLLSLSHARSAIVADEASVQGYRTALERLASVETLIEPFLVDEVDEPAGPPATIAFYRELELSRRLFLASRNRPLRMALRSILEEDLPDGAPAEIHLYFQHRCAQACQFCEQPRRRTKLSGRMQDMLLDAQRFVGLDLVTRGVLDLLLSEAGRREPPAVVQITGDDWARHPALDDLLLAVERHPDVPVGFCGPSTRLAERALAERLARLPRLIRVTLTLQSPDQAVHDAIAGAPGSCEEVLAAIDNATALGMPLVVNVVLTEAAVDALPDTLEWLAAHGLRGHAQAFIPDRGLGTEGDAITPRADHIRSTLENAGPRASSALASLHGVPLCAVPAGFRDRVTKALMTPERQAAAYPSSCEPCQDRASCSGVPASYVRRHGAAGLDPRLDSMGQGTTSDERQ